LFREEVSYGGKWHDHPGIDVRSSWSLSRTAHPGAIHDLLIEGIFPMVCMLPRCFTMT
jgi:hypothetical protein